MEQVGVRIGLLSGSVSRTGGGVFEAVVAHARLLRSLGHDVVAFGIEDEHSAEDCARFDGGEVFAVPRRGPAIVGYAPTLLRTLLASGLDGLHLHGIWQFPSRAAMQWARRTGRPYLISPHGMLDPWIVGRGQLRKLVARIAYERASWRSASIFHALTEAEAGDIRTQTGCGSIAVIPNAVTPVIAEQPGLAPDVRYILYLSRIHPKKNVEALAEAWSLARGRSGAWDHRLLICGWGDPATVARLEARLAASGDPSIEFLGPVFGPRREALVAGARFLVLPSFSEGLPMAILEAWAAGVPTLMSENCNLAVGFGRTAAIDTGTSVATIAAALSRAFVIDAAGHAAMSAAARALAESRFAPANVAQAWERLYRQLAPGPTRLTDGRLGSLDKPTRSQKIAGEP